MIIILNNIMDSQPAKNLGQDAFDNTNTEKVSSY